MSRLKLDALGRVMRYECEDLDAGLPMHAHAPGSGMEHDVRCDSGSILVWAHPSSAFVLQAGQTLVLDTTLWHGIVPLTPGATFMNTTMGYEHDELHTVLESPHSAPAWVIAARDRALETGQKIESRKCAM